MLSKGRSPCSPLIAGHTGQGSHCEQNQQLVRSRWYKQPAMADVDWRVVAVDKITGKSHQDAIKTLVNPFGSLGEGKRKEKQTGTHTKHTHTLDTAS